jgi:hypothetical protein
MVYVDSSHRVRFAYSCRSDLPGVVLTYPHDASLRRADTWEAGEWQKGGWRYMRVREDKKLANDISVIEKIQRSRADDIKQTEVRAELSPPCESSVLT